MEDELNLSQDDNCWIEKDAVVCDNAKVTDDALVTDKAIVSGSAKIKDDAKVSGNALVRDSATVMLKGEIKDHAIAEQNCVIMGIVNGRSIISGSVTISPKTFINTKHIFGKSLFNDTPYSCTFRDSSPIYINDTNYRQYSIIPISRDFYFTVQPNGFVELFLPESFYKAIKSESSICANSFKELWYKFLDLVSPLVESVPLKKAMFQFFAKTEYTYIGLRIIELASNFCKKLFDMARDEEAKAAIRGNALNVLILHQKAREYFSGYFLGLLLYTCKRVSPNFAPSFSEYGIDDVINLFNIDASTKSISDINIKVALFNKELLNMVKEVCDLPDDWQGSDFFEVGGSLLRKLLY